MNGNRHLVLAVLALMVLSVVYSAEAVDYGPYTSEIRALKNSDMDWRWGTWENRIVCHVGKDVAGKLSRLDLRSVPYLIKALQNDDQYVIVHEALFYLLKPYYPWCQDLDPHVDYQLPISNTSDGNSTITTHYFGLNVSYNVDEDRFFIKDKSKEEVREFWSKHDSCIQEFLSSQSPPK